MTQNVTVKDVEYKHAGRTPVDQFMPGDLIGSSTDLLIVKSEQDPNDQDQWLLTWKNVNTDEVTEWEGIRTSADVRYVPAMYIIKEDAL